MFIFISILFVHSINCQNIIFPDKLPSLRNKPCTTDQGKDGICQPVVACTSVVSTNSKPLTYCDGFTKQFICCIRSSGGGTPQPLTNPVNPPRVNFECGKRSIVNIFTSLFRRKRRATIQKGVPDFGIIKPNPIIQVVGGIDSIRNSWPWMALIGRKSRRNNNIEWFCDGALINEQWIITAAHCAESDGNFIVRLGEHDYSTSTDDANHQDFSTIKIVPYPDYDTNKADHDLLLIKLNKKVNLNENINPVCLPWGTKTNSEFIDEKVTLTGWGTTSFRGQTSSILQEVNITVFNHEICDKSYSILKDYPRLWPNGMSSNNVLCAGDVKGGKDACQGDSGGPLVLNENGVYVQIGVVSTGFGCGLAEFPGIYMPLSQNKYLEWIKRIAF